MFLATTTGSSQQLSDYDWISREPAILDIRGTDDFDLDIITMYHKTHYLSLLGLSVTVQ